MTPTDRAKKLLKELDAVDGEWSQYDTNALPIIAEYRAEIEAPLLAEIERLRKLQNSVIELSR